jgi:hypothetical protein
MTTLKVYEAICNVIHDMSRDGIAKNNRNQQQGYNFRGIDDVYSALSPVLARNKLCILPRVVSREQVERQTSKGGAIFYTCVHVEFDFVSAEDGSKHTIATVGEAMDSADKSSNKAMSAAFKYAAFQAFCIPTEGDNDADAHTHQVAAQAQQAPQSMKPADVKRHIAAIKAAKSGEALKEAFKVARNHAAELNDEAAFAQFQAAKQEVIDAHTKQEPAEAAA